MNNDQQRLMVSVSGVRGIVGSSLTPEVATAFAAALGAWLDGRPVVLSRDSRPSGEMLQHAVAAGLLSVGCDVYRIGVAPTPTVGLAVRQLGAGGGMQITASHNPAPYNGLKFFGPRGMVLTATEGEQVLGLHKAGNLPRADWAGIGQSRPLTVDPFRHHVARVLEQVDAARIRTRHFRVFLDANHGAGGPLGLRLLGELGCEVVQHGCGPDGQFAHDPEPVEANLREIAPLVEQKQCVIGFALDPDADRLALIDEQGRCIGEELTLALAVDVRLRQKPGSVVINMSTSRVIEDIAQRRGSTVERAPVGEANVVERMLSIGAVIGGEGNGGVIDPRVGLVRDPFVGMAMMLNLLAETGKSLSTLVAEMPEYYIVKEKLQVTPANLLALYNGLTQQWPDAKANRADGLRLEWVDRWVHVRPSNTEPLVRVIAEAPRREDAQELCSKVNELARS
jgi:phosphomannomutase